MSLERVIGNTAKGNNTFAVNPVTGDIAYPAGCVLVFFSPRRNRQTQFFSCQSGKPLACVSFSADGSVVCAGEGGRHPAVLVWDADSGVLLAELKGHSFSVRCVCISGNADRVATLGSPGDARLNVWEWRSGTLLASTRINFDVQSLCLSQDGQELLTAGKQGHMKKWVIETSRTVGKCGSLKGLKYTFDGGPPSKGDFMDAALWPTSEPSAPASSSSTYAVTLDGFLLLFDPHRILTRWVDLRSSAVVALCVTEAYVACACGSGVVRLFAPESLEYVCTVPRPPLFRPPSRSKPPQHQPLSETGGSSRASEGAAWRPDAVGVRVTANSRRLAAVYADRSIVVWDIRDTKKIFKCRTLHAHSASVWDVEFLPRDACLAAGLPEDSFVTCSSDCSIRLWALPPLPSSAEYRADAKPSALKELRGLRALDDLSATSSTATSPAAEASRCGGALRCLRVSPDGKHLATGDRAGNVWVHGVSAELEEEARMEAHDAEVLALDYGGAGGSLLATASRDRLIHVFDRGSAYSLCCTLDDHASAVTSVRFAAGGRRLVSSGGDKRVIMRSVVTGERGVRVDAAHATSVPSATIYDMAVDASGRMLVTAGQERGPVLLDVASGARKRSYETEAESTLRVRMDPTSVFFATSSSDRSIRVYDMLGGESVMTASGHAEPITGLAFAYDLERLVSVSGDGCIFVWRLPEAVSDRMKERRDELLRQMSLKAPLDPVPESKPLLDSDEQTSQECKRQVSASPAMTEREHASHVRKDTRIGEESALGPRGEETDGSRLELNGSGVLETSGWVNSRGGEEEDDERLANEATGSSGCGPMEDDSDDEPISDPQKSLLDKDEDFEVRVSAHELGGMLGSLSADAPTLLDAVLDEELAQLDAAERDQQRRQQQPQDLQDIEVVIAEEAAPADGAAAVRLSLSSIHNSCRRPHDGERTAATAASSDPDAAPGSEDGQSTRLDETFVLETPRSNIIRECDLTGISTPSTPDRSGSRIGQEKTRALAVELDKMRNQLQAMGMCGGLLGAPHPTPVVSAAPSVHNSPAKPPPLRRRDRGGRGGPRNPAEAPDAGSDGPGAATVKAEAAAALKSEGAAPKQQTARKEQHHVGGAERVEEGEETRKPGGGEQGQRGRWGEESGASGGEALPARPGAARAGSEGGASRPLSLAEERDALREALDATHRSQGLDDDLPPPPPPQHKRTRPSEPQDGASTPPPAQATRAEAAVGGGEAGAIDVRLKMLELRRRKGTPQKTAQTQGTGDLGGDQASREVTPLKVAKPTEQTEGTAAAEAALWSEQQMDERRKAAAAAAEKIRTEIEEAKRRALDADRALKEAEEEAKRRKREEVEEEERAKREAEAKERAEEEAKGRAQAEEQRKRLEGDRKRAEKRREEERRREERRKEEEARKREEREREWEREKELEESRKAARAANRATAEARRLVLEREREVQQLREAEAALRAKAEEEAAAREAAQEAALGALLVIRKVQDGLPDPALLSLEAGARGSAAHAGGSLVPESPHASLPGSREWEGSARQRPAHLKESVLAWAQELAVEVVSAVTVSSDQGGEAAEEAAAGEEDGEEEPELAEGTSRQVHMSSGPEVFEAPSGAGELEEDMSVDEEEPKCELAQEEVVASVERNEMQSCADTVLAARQSAGVEAEGETLAEHTLAEVTLEAAALGEEDGGGEGAGGDVRWSRVAPYASMEQQEEQPERAEPAAPAETRAAGWEGGAGRGEEEQRRGRLVQPARSGDPNHPLLVRKACGASLDASVCSSVMEDLSQQSGQTLCGERSAAGLEAALEAALNLLTVARAAGREEVTQDMVAVLRRSQQRIEETLGACDEEPCDVTTIQAPPPLRAPDAPRRHSGADPHLSRATSAGAAAAAVATTQQAPLEHSGSRASGPGEDSGALQGGSSALPSARSSLEMDHSEADRSHFGTNMSAISAMSAGSKVEEVLERFSERLVKMVTRKLSKGETAGTAAHWQDLLGEERRGVLI